MTAQISEEDIHKAEFIKALLEIEPKTTKPPKNTNVWVQYIVSKKEYDEYIYKITNNNIVDNEGKNKVFTISGTVKNLGNRTETDHESRMIAYLCERGLIYDRTRPTKDELLVVNYNKSLFSTSDRKSSKVLFNRTISYLFFNDRDITKDRLVGLFSHGTTEIRIFDENKKGSVTQLVKSTKSMIEFPADPTLIGNSHEKPRRVSGNTFVQKSETTKAWDAINRDMEKYPELANQLKTTPEEVHQMRKMHSLRDQLIYFGTEYENTFGNSMVKDSSHEKFEVTLKNLMNQFQALNIVQPTKTESAESNLASSKNAGISNNPYLVNNSSNSKKIKIETLS